MKSKESTNVFLDTSSFIKNNYLASNSIKQLIQLSEELKIDLYITDIVKREVLKNMNEGLLSLSITLSRNPIWKNDKNSNVFFNIKKDSNLISAFESIIRSGIIKVIKTPKKTMYEVFDLYFNNEPPFANKKKKNEFLDAFILLTIEDWCEKNNSKAILFSNDEDQLAFNSNNFKVDSDINSFLQSFVDYSFKIEDIPIKTKIDELIKVNTSNIREQIRYLFEAEFEYETRIELDNYDLDYNSMHVTEIEFKNFKTISANPSNAFVESSVVISYEYRIVKRDKQFNIIDTIERQDKINVPVDLTINLERGIKIGGYDLIQADIKWEYKKIKIYCG